jgi:hypothetical protein
VRRHHGNTVAGRLADVRLIITPQALYDPPLLCFENTSGVWGQRPHLLQKTYALGIPLDTQKAPAFPPGPSIPFRKIKLQQVLP